ncbi:MAG TPA: hypothetical protein VK403_10500, partial [Allosphingosinicella sp.]|nr:hypothetical protein [Allosphingosinicella sp.]
MTNDPGTRFATADRSTIGAAPAPGQEQEQEQEQERAAAQAPPLPGDGNPAVAPAQGPGTTAVAARPSREENEERWLEAIAYALLALAGVGAIGVLMLWRAVRELRRIAGSREVSR